MNDINQPIFVASLNHQMINDLLQDFENNMPLANKKLQALHKSLIKSPDRSQLLELLERILQKYPYASYPFYLYMRTLRLAGDYKKCAQLFEGYLDFSALPPDQNFNLVKYERYYLSLYQGDLKRAADEFDSLWKLGNMCDIPKIIDWRTKGTKFITAAIHPNQLTQKKSLAVYSSNGFGDFVQMLRMIRQPYDAGWDVQIVVKTAAIKKALYSYVQAHFPSVNLVTLAEANRPDYFIASTIMGAIGDIGLDEIPPPEPTNLSPDIQEKWQSWLQAKRKSPEKRVIGISVSGDHNNQNNHFRIVPLAQLHQALAGKAEFIILNNSLSKKDKSYLDKTPDILNPFADHDTDILDLCAIIDLCDLVVGVDSFPVHLAGVQLKPVWTMLYEPAEYRWMQGRDDSPYYPTMRLFRQDKRNPNQDTAWLGVLGQISARLGLYWQALDQLPSQDLHLYAFLEQKGFVRELIGLLAQKCLQGQAFQPPSAGALGQTSTLFSQLKQDHLQKLLLMAMAAAKQGHSGCANGWFHLLLVSDETKAIARLSLAFLSLNAGWYEKFKYHIQLLPETPPASGRPLLSIDLPLFANGVYMLITKGDFDLAQALDQKAAGWLYHKKRDYQMALASKLLKAGLLPVNYSKNIPAFQQKILSFVPNSYVTFMTVNRHYETLVAYFYDQIEKGYDISEIISSLAKILRYLGRHDEAKALLHNALKTKPNDDALLFELGYLQIYDGELDKGYKNLLPIWQNPLKLQSSGSKFIADHQDKLLRVGDDVKGKHIAVMQRDGFGNMIQYLRFSADLIDRGAKVILMVPDSHKPIASYIQAVLPTATVTNSVDNIGFDHIVVNETLPAFGKWQVDKLPPPLALKSEGALKDKWQNWLQGQLAGLNLAKNSLKIGFVMGGEKTNHNDLLRSMPLDMFLQNFAGQGRLLVNLQSWLTDQETALIGHSPYACNAMEKINDFIDLTALVDNLDLIIAVDSGIVHLAGSQGKPCWAMLYEPAEYRWMAGHADTPWYPSVRLFRQDKRLPNNQGDWGPVIPQVRAALDAFETDFHK